MPVVVLVSCPVRPRSGFVVSAFEVVEATAVLNVVALLPLLSLLLAGEDDLGVDDDDVPAAEDVDGAFSEVGAKPMQ